MNTDVRAPSRSGAFTTEDAEHTEKIHR